MEKVKNYFADFIGQTDVVFYLCKVVHAILTGRLLPLQPIFLEGHAGLGKTSLAKFLAKILAPAGFQFVEIPASITLPAFLQLWGNLIEGKQVVIFMDEVHEIKNTKVKCILKRILETEKSVAPIATDSGHLTSNPFQHFWIFASNEEPKDSALFGPSSRTKALLLMPYSNAEVKAIIRQKCEKWDVKVDADAVEYLSGRVINNGRAVSELVENDLLLEGEKITLKVAKRIVEKTKRFPLGLRSVDVKTLQCLANEPRGRQVSELAAMCGGEAPQTTSYRLQALAGLGFTLTTGSGRKALTDSGAKYLKALMEMQAAAKAALKGAATKAKAKAVKEKSAKAETKAEVATK